MRVPPEDPLCSKCAVGAACIAFGELYVHVCMCNANTSRQKASELHVYKYTDMYALAHAQAFMHVFERARAHTPHALVS